MRFINLNKPKQSAFNYSPYPHPERSEEEERLETYKAQAWMYLFLHFHEVKIRYAEYIFKQLCEQNSELKVNNLEPKETVFFSSYACQFIEEYILLCDEALVLCNLEKEPCVVVDAYAFTNYDIDAFEERMLAEYIQNNPNREKPAFQTAFTRKATTKAAGFVIGSGLNKTGTSLINTGARLSRLSNHYASGHESLMRLQRSFRGKKAQQEALSKLIDKSSRYGKSAAQKKATGTVLTRLGSKLKKGTFRPVTVFDALNPWEVADDTSNARMKDEAKRLVLPELEIYCERNNNYQTIINQQYFCNADE